MNISKDGFFASLNTNDYSKIAQEFGLAEENEKIVSVSDKSYVRGGAECFFSEIKVSVIDCNNNNKKDKYFVAKAWLGSNKGKMISERRTSLSNSGLKTLSEVHHIKNKDASSIIETIEQHASPKCYEASVRVKNASEYLDQMKESEAKDLGVFAAILDLNRYSPTRILADVLVTDNGLVFNDFGHDLGEPGPETYIYFGCEMPCEYKSGKKCLEEELKKYPDLLKSAILSYEKHISSDRKHNGTEM